MKMLFRYVLLFSFLFIQSVYSQQKTYATVTKITDGDTFHVVINKEKKIVRLIGIDAPESRNTGKNKLKHPLGNYATQCLRQMIPVGSRIVLVSDIQNTDRYNRILRYGYTAGSTISINERMVSSGCAFAVTYPPNVQLQQKLNAAQRLAQSKALGIWK